MDLVGTWALRRLESCTEFMVKVYVTNRIILPGKFLSLLFLFMLSGVIGEYGGGETEGCVFEYESSEKKKTIYLNKLTRDFRH